MILLLLGLFGLLANGTIEPSYVAALFRSHEELGPYYVLGPGLAMPHARPEDGVNRLGLGLTVLKTGVNFGSEGNDPIQLLITLAVLLLNILARVFFRDRAPR